MLLTPLAKLRKAAPGSLTAAKIVELMKRRGLQRSVPMVTAFERGQIKEPDERFVELYAEIIGQPLRVVREDLLRTQRMRARGTGPFVDKRVA
jgi:hypothetical protein